MRYGLPAVVLLGLALLIDACRVRGELIQCATCGHVIGAHPGWTLEHHDDWGHTAHPPVHA